MKNSFCSKYFSSSSFLSFLCQSLNFLLFFPPSWSLTIWCPPLFARLNWNHIVKTPNIYQQTLWRCEKAGSLRIMPITHIQPFFVAKDSTDLRLFRIIKSLATDRWMESLWSPPPQVPKIKKTSPSANHNIKCQRLCILTKLCSAPRFSSGRQPRGYYWIPG